MSPGSHYQVCCRHIGAESCSSRPQMANQIFCDQRHIALLNRRQSLCMLFASNVCRLEGVVGEWGFQITPTRGRVEFRLALVRAQYRFGSGVMRQRRYRTRKVSIACARASARKCWRHCGKSGVLLLPRLPLSLPCLPAVYRGRDALVSACAFYGVSAAGGQRAHGEPCGGQITMGRPGRNSLINIDQVPK